MPHSIWNGTIAFGLVIVPVKVYSATESRSVHFHEVHLPDGSRIEHRRICPRDGQQVEHRDVVKGFEVAPGEWVEVGDEEIAAAAGPRNRLVDVDHFVPTDDIAPEYFERTYYLGTGQDGAEAYALLHAALERAGRAGVGRWVFHNRERTVIVRPLRDVLAMHTMRFAEDLVNPRDIELGAVHRAPTEREIAMALALVEGLHTEFDPAAYEDTYRAAVMEVIERKAAGKPIEPLEEPEPVPEDDLVAALEASMRRATARA
jgi:DNA end-binding protein Ku